MRRAHTCPSSVLCPEPATLQTLEGRHAQKPWECVTPASCGPCADVYGRVGSALQCCQTAADRKASVSTSMLSISTRVTVAGMQHTQDPCRTVRGLLWASGEALRERQAAAAAGRQARLTNLLQSPSSPDPMPHMLRQVLPQHKLQPVAALGIQLVAHQPALLQLVQRLGCSLAALLLPRQVR